ncbi:NRDE family protein [Sphaerisporangium melleum]|uniref:NRDE family protein n=1 Tax=Sphaerisporangium melleum TaxID=321316 RepID=UPI0027DB0586|nr:NRDE family protein [Sphaerisporangium melleum]
MIVSFAPGSATPVVLAGVRDELLSRPWQAPAAHWPDRPALVGGRDLLAGGTWLAADPGGPRVAALLNGRGTEAPGHLRRSRGVLPLEAVVHGGPPADLTPYDPFHLLVAGRRGVRLWSWDGAEVTEAEPPAGVHIVVNSGWETGEQDPRVAFFRPRFAAAVRPSAVDAGGVTWEDWHHLAAGAGLPVTDPRALVVRRELGDGRVWGTSSVTLVALGVDGLRYDFCPRPGDASSWHTVLHVPPVA